jgi:hypothetical protein
MNDPGVRLDFFVWSQPLDRDRPDVMSDRGRLLAPDEHALRQRWIAALEGVSRTTRRRIPGGGFVARGRRIAFGELPIAEPRGPQADTIVVGVKPGPWPAAHQRRLLDEVQRISELGGFTPDAQVLNAALNHLIAAARPRFVGRWLS